MSSCPAEWPDVDLQRSLIDLYFESFNGIHPILHRPTFERDFESRRFETNPDFSDLCLCVFAFGARFSNDPRVLREGEAEDMAPYSKGWKYVECIQRATLDVSPKYSLPGMQVLLLRA